MNRSSKFSNGGGDDVDERSLFIDDGKDADGFELTNGSSHTNLSSRTKTNGHNGHRLSSIFTPSRDIPGLNTNGEESYFRNGSHSLMENMDTVEDDEHREFFDDDTSFGDRIKFECIRTIQFIRVMTEAHVASIVLRNKVMLSSKNILRTMTAGVCVTFIIFSIYLSRNREVYEYNAKMHDPSPDHYLESPLKLVTEYIGDTGDGVFPATTGAGSKIPPLEDRIWFQKGKEHPPDFIKFSPMMEHNLVDTSMPWRASFVPLFWHIPRSAGGCMKEMISSCLNLIQASDAGAEGHENDDVLEVVFVKGGGGNHPHRYVNVDTMRMPGIQHAKKLGLVENELARVITTLYVQDVPVLFNPQHRAQLFTIMRHPVSRSISLFYYLRSSYGSENYLPAHMTLEGYAQSSRLEFNWMTRFLTGRLVGTLTQEDVDMAKAIFRRKVIVGLLEEKEETIRRFASSFHWNKRIGDREQKCLDNLAFDDWPNKQPSYPELSRDSKTWFMLEEKNEFDMQLYYYAKTLFEQQAVLF